MHPGYTQQAANSTVAITLSMKLSLKDSSFCVATSNINIISNAVVGRAGFPAYNTWCAQSKLLSLVLYCSCLWCSLSTLTSKFKVLALFLFLCNRACCGTFDLAETKNWQCWWIIYLEYDVLSLLVLLLEYFTCYNSNEVCYGKSIVGFYGLRRQ